MVLTTTTCSFHSRPPIIPSIVTQTLPSVRPKMEISWRKQCVVGIACLIIGLQTEGLVMNNHDFAIAIEPKAGVEMKIKAKEQRWSNKRMCPAWQLNSLETLVPEDLPRPSFKRRWEAVGDRSRVDQPHKPFTTTIDVAGGGDCFSM